MWMSNNVDDPKHYAQDGRKMQPIQSMYYGMTQEQFRGYCIGCCHKYIYRFNKKNGIEDLEKAKKYIEFLINSEQGLDPLYSNKSR